MVPSCRPISLAFGGSTRASPSWPVSNEQSKSRNPCGAWIRRMLNPLAGPCQWDAPIFIRFISEAMAQEFARHQRTVSARSLRCAAIISWSDHHRMVSFERHERYNAVRAIWGFRSTGPGCCGQMAPTDKSLVHGGCFRQSAHSFSCPRRKRWASKGNGDGPPDSLVA